MSVYPPPYEIVPIFEPEKFPLLDATTQSLTDLVNQYNVLNEEVNTLGTTTGKIINIVPNLLNATGIDSGVFAYIPGPTTGDGLVVGGKYWMLFNLTCMCDNPNDDFTSGISVAIEFGNTTVYQANMTPRATQNVDLWTFTISYPFTFTSQAFNINILCNLNSGGTYSCNSLARVATSALSGLTYANTYIQIMRLQ